MEFLRIIARYLIELGCVRSLSRELQSKPKMQSTVRSLFGNCEVSD